MKNVKEFDVQRDASIKGWCIEALRDNDDYIRLDITDKKLRDMGILSTRPDIVAHLEELLNLLTCSDVA